MLSWHQTDFVCFASKWLVQDSWSTTRPNRLRSQINKNLYFQKWAVQNNSFGDKCPSSSRNNWIYWKRLSELPFQRFHNWSIHYLQHKHGPSCSYFKKHCPICHHYSQRRHDSLPYLTQIFYTPDHRLRTIQQTWREPHETSIQQVTYETFRVNNGKIMHMVNTVL